jgi:acyl carrier protein
MILEELVTIVKEQFIDDQDVSLINPDVSFKKLESYDSLTGMAIITTLEEDLDIKILVDDYKKMQTIRDLFEYITNLKNK